jgi:hypothetical protein
MIFHPLWIVVVGATVTMVLTMFWSWFIWTLHRQLAAIGRRFRFETLLLFLGWFVIMLICSHQIALVAASLER